MNKGRGMYRGDLKIRSSDRRDRRFERARLAPPSRNRETSRGQVNGDIIIASGRYSL